ncbi:UPF0711 protein C18orf21 homolog [Pygocentrus nattereri]|uniref:Uncharacterized protein n=1 Tax=Pygocentrus nattereri TaxID=42514 RepID=A0A3B4DIZ3_PYGNA|nr:UPF0711 protein C18orf21 homolog [Pygocentrus nattereri]
MLPSFLSPAACSTPETTADKKQSVDRTLQFLMEASMLYKDACPEQARFLMQKHQTSAPALPAFVLCPFCFQWRQPGEYHVRVWPKRRPSAQVRRLLRKEAAHRRLGAEERKVLQKFKKASNVLMATCHTCNKTSRQVGVNREFMASFSKTYGTPASTSKRRTPQSANKSTPKSGIHEKTPGRTPGRTPASKSSNTSSSSKSVSGKMSTFSRLKKLLMVDDNQKSKRGGLKDFLCSL